MKKLKSCNVLSCIAATILLGALATLPACADYPSLVLAQSPLDYWRLNETTPSPAINSFSNLGSAGPAATGYSVAGALPGQTGIVGNCILITNVGQQVGDCYAKVNIPNLPALNPEPPFTIEVWAKPNTPFSPSDANGLCLLSSLSPFPGDGSRSGYIIYATPTSWEFYVGGEQSYTAQAKASGPVSTTSFTHLVGEFDGTNLYFYTNGVLAAAASVNLSNPFHPNQWVPTRLGGTSLLGGEYTDANGNGAYFVGNRGWDGWIDEFAVYNTILSSNTIKSHYTTATTTPSGYDALVLASHPVGYWNLDEPAYTPPDPSTYTFAADLGTLGDSGTNTVGTLADQPGVPGLSAGDHAVDYNGSAGSLVLNTNVTPPNLGGTSITLAAWIKPTSYGYVSDIIAQGYDEATYAENFLRVGDAFDWEAFSANNSGGNYNPAVVPDVAFYEVGAYDGGPGYVSAVFPAPAGDIGHWVFLAGTFDGVNWNLYRNGSLVAQYPGTFADGSAAGPTALTLPWSVGSRSNPNPYFGHFFDGAISEAAIFPSALSASTIQALYNSVPLPPVITQAPQAPSPAYLGSSAAFSVWADGSPTLAYQWTSNGVPVAGQTTTNFSLTGLTAAANATYSVIVTNTYGAATSSVVLVVTPTLPPATLVPAVETRWLGSPLSFAPASLPNQQLSYQWNLNGHNILGATSSSYTATTLPGSIGTYTLVISNTFGASTSSVATLSALTPPNSYVSTILADSPLSYFRLDETGGTVAHDYAGGNDGNFHGAIVLGRPGYSLIDTDYAIAFPGVANSYIGDFGATAINFSGTKAEFSIEAWANGGPGQISDAAIIVKGTGNNLEIETEQFAMGVTGNNLYRFYVNDAKGNIAEADATSGPDGAWHHLVGVCDGVAGTLTLYVDGAIAGTHATPAAGLINSSDAVSIGAERSGTPTTFDWAYNGTIDEVAIYPTALSAAQVQAHYAAAYGPNLAPFISVQPVSATNYVSLPVTLRVSAAGTVPLTYQWNHVGLGAVSGATAASFTIPNLAYTDAGTYTVGVTNAAGGTNSLPVTITVLAPPSNPPAIAGLVMHLPFDGNLIDATGRGNNGTNEASGGAPLLTTDYEPGVIGQAFTFQTTADTSTTNANYASLGVRPDLQFGASINFSVSMWVQLPANYTGNDVPFFTDTIGSTFGKGYVFAPSSGSASTANPNGWPGAWAFSIFDTAGVGIGVFGDVGTINDGNFHSLIYVIDRKLGATVYLDGLLAHQNVQAGSTTVTQPGDIDTTNSATIGQDPTGLYAESTQGSFAIDDLGVWQKALTPLEAASIYMAAVSNKLSFVGAPITLSLQAMPGHQLQLNWDGGSLQSATNLSGPWTSVSGSPPLVVSPTGESMFFRVKL